MTKRILAAGMWLFLIAWAWNYAAWLFGVPEGFGPLIGLAVLLVMWVDPLGLLDGHREERPSQTRRIVRGV